MKRKPFLPAVLLLALAATPARAEVTVDWGAYLENDLRVAVDRVDDPGINRNTTSIGLNLNAGLLPDKLRFVGNVQFAWVGFTQDMEFHGLTMRDKVSPYYLESNAAYIEVLSVLPGLDLRVGRQVVHWGVADMFNPTDNLNSTDLEDPLKFGEAIANEMIRLDYALGDNFIFTAVWVPVFQPAQLPSSALIAIGDTSAEMPFIDPKVRLEGEKIRNLWLANPAYYEVDDPNVTAHMPKTTLANSQFGLKVQWLAGLFDMSLSYYQGYDDLPKPKRSVSSTRKTTSFAPDGSPVVGVVSDVDLVYPKQKVLGFDLAGQIGFLDDAGFWFEGAFVFPERIEMEFDVTAVAAGARIIHGEVVSPDPFFKCTTGMDYSINKYVFITGQFIHGFIDEFGAYNIHNYWVGGGDIKLLSERLLLRVFVVGEVPHEDDDIELDQDHDGLPDSPAIGAHNDGTIASYVLYPSITVKPVDGLELGLGGYFLMGHEESAFARPAAGPSLAFFRAKAAF
ncbi:MAG: hypothetical protein PHU25_06085 [Deltaproteobacteria bacterium]|nr:hypothetical protein [Deltaproteobacteria bacterium]